MNTGIFNELNPAIIIMQDETVLRRLANSPFLMEEELSLKQALCDYYEAKKFQVLRPKFLKTRDHEDTIEMVDHILQKLVTA